eukprot:7032696-Prymnesium_polylepis.1
MQTKLNAAVAESLQHAAHQMFDHICAAAARDTVGQQLLFCPRCSSSSPLLLSLSFCSTCSRPSARPDRKAA